MSGGIGKISTDEAKCFKVARYVNDQGTFRIDVDEDCNFLDIRRVIQRKFLFWRFGVSLVVAKLHLEKPDNWIMSVYGRAVREDCETLAKKLAEEFKTHVHVKLVQESIGYSTDYYD